MLDDPTAVSAADEHEQGVLAGCLLDPMVATEVAGTLKADDFHRPEHRTIFRAVRSLVDREETTGPMAVRDELERMGVADVDYNGYGYLIDLHSTMATAAQVAYCTGRVRETSRRRHLVSLAHRIKDLALDDTVSNPVDTALGLLMAVDEGRGKNRRHIADVLRSQYDAIERAQRAKKEGNDPVIQTGFYDLDRKVVLTPGKMVVLAARPAMGKSALAFNIACNVARGRPVLHVTLEMTGEELASRIFTDATGLDSWQQAHGVAADDDWTKLARTITDYQRLKLDITDDPAMSIGAIMADARRYQAECGEPLGLVVVDYLGLIEDEATKEEYAKVTKISRDVKKLAKSLGVPVLVLSQLNRKVEERPDKRPEMSDLRQSGAIEQDADVVMFLYRDAYYNPDSADRTTELLVRKNRGGSVGVIKLVFDPIRTRFESYRGEFPPGGMSHYGE